MSIEKTIQAFKDHISSFLDEPVFIGWPIDDKKGIHIFVYSVTDVPDARFRFIDHDIYPQEISVLIFANPENEYSVIDNVLHALHRHPIFEVEDAQSVIWRDSILVQDFAQIFVARNQPYRLSLAYKFRSLVSKATLQELQENKPLNPISP
jgi:hypothetical protein